MISIIIPVYRVEDYLRRCVSSVFAQTFADYEVILVDDGSPDRCGEICDEITREDVRVRVIHKENGGLSSARNAGIDAAQGEYLFFLDSDDVIHPQTLDILYSGLMEHDADLAVGSISRFSKENEIDLKHIHAPYVFECLSGEQMLHGYFGDWAYRPRCNSSCGKLYRRELLEGIRFPLGRLFEDEYMTYRIYARAKRVVVTELALYGYFSNIDGITGTLSLEKWLDEYDAQWERLVFFKVQGLVELYHKALLEYLSYAKWNLIACREKKEPVDAVKLEHFNQQYREVCRRAEQERVITFGQKHFDYYVLAYPEKTTYLRIKRIALKAIGRFR